MSRFTARHTHRALLGISILVLATLTGCSNSNSSPDDVSDDTSTLILGSETSAQDAFVSNERIATALELFTATTLDFNGNGVADVLLPNYDGNLPQSRFGGFDLVLDRSDLSMPIVFDGSNGGRIT